MDYSTPGFPALHYLPEFVQIHVPWVGDTIQPSHPPPRSSPFAFSLSPSWITALSWQRGLHNSMKLWAMPYRATQEGCVIVESSKMWSTGGGNGKSLKYSCLKNPMNMNSVLWPWASFTPYQTLKKKVSCPQYITWLVKIKCDGGDESDLQMTNSSGVWDIIIV